MKGLISVAAAMLSLASTHAVFKAAKKSQPKVAAWRRAIHQNPELDFQEVRGKPVADR